MPFFVGFLFLWSNILLAQCPAGEVEIIINSGGGTADDDLWITITTGPNGTGTVIWAQGNGTIGDADGPLTNQSVCVPEGVDLYINCYDQYDDSWEGAVYTVTSGGMVVVNNGGAVPDDGSDTDGSSSWQTGTTDLETSELFQVSEVVDVTLVPDVCEDDAPFIIMPDSAFNPNSGKAGIAIFIITPDDVSAAGVDFSIQNFDGDYFYNENDLKADNGGSIQPNSLYMLYDNPCFDVNDAGSTPMFLWITDDIPQSSSTIDGCGYYIYYYACDALEVINNRSSTYVSGDPSTYQGYYYDPSDPNGLGNVPSFYTANTSKRAETIWTTASKKIIIPNPTDHEYVSYGEWSGNGVTSVGTQTKNYFSAFPGLATTLTVPSGHAEFDPSAVSPTANSPLTFTYHSVYGVNGPAVCDVVTTVDTAIDVHALPEITMVQNQTCDQATYSVTLNVDLDVYNVSVDEDGATPFDVIVSGGTVSSNTLTGTGEVQIVISNIPTGSSWSLDISDPSGLNCGNVGTSGDCISVLPIRLSQFDGRKMDGDNLLFWETLSEKNNDYFILERAEDNLMFEAIAQVDGAGNSNYAINYQFLDKNVRNDAYYRLKQVDFDGATSYSDIVFIPRNGSSGAELYPNPNNGSFYLNYDAEFDEDLEVKIYDASGKLIYDHQFRAEMSENTFGIHLQNTSPGIYLMTLTGQRTSRSLPVIVN